MIIVLALLVFAYFALVKLLFFLLGHARKYQKMPEWQGKTITRIARGSDGWLWLEHGATQSLLPSSPPSAPLKTTPPSILPLRQPPSLPRPAGHGSSGRRLAGRGAAAAPPTMPRRRFL